MSTIILSAKPVVEKIKTELTREVTEFSKKSGRRPKLAVVIVGQDPASVIYTRKKGEAAFAVGMEHETLSFPENVSVDEVRTSIKKLNGDPAVDGILIQRPLPKSFKEEDVLYWIHPTKDVDAFHPENAGRLWLGLKCFQPCTPSGVMEILRHYGIDVCGKSAVVVGRSTIVGKPMAALLTAAHATVTLAHSQTRDLEAVVKKSDLVVAAIGKPEMIPASWIKKGAIVIDVGINRLSSGKIVGDIDAKAEAHAGAITPVPGGVGPMTISILLKNTLRAAQESSPK